MTNFEKILHDTPKEDMAEALMELYNGSCAECPALELCDSLPEEEMHIGCRGVLLRWLDMEAEQEHEAAAEAEGRDYRDKLKIKNRWLPKQTTGHGKSHEDCDHKSTLRGELQAPRKTKRAGTPALSALHETPIMFIALHAYATPMRFCNDSVELL